MWKAGGADSGALGIYEVVAALREKSAGVPAKRVALSETLVAKQKWRGAMTALEMPATTIDSKLFTVDIAPVDKSGAMPWLVANRWNQWRSGPSAFPLPGYGSFIMVEPDAGVRQFFVLVPCEAVLMEGISMRDVASFFDSPSGGKLFGKQCLVYELSHNSLLWVPYGYNVVAFAMERTADDDDNNQEEKKEKNSKKKVAKQLGNAFFWVWTPFATQLATCLSERTWRAIYAWNQEYLMKNQEVRIWSERLVVVQGRAKVVEESRPS